MQLVGWIRLSVIVSIPVFSHVVNLLKDRKLALKLGI
jgi:hypothetical protein